MSTQAETYKELPLLTLPTKASWATWLKSKGAKESGAWVKLGKKGGGLKTLTYEEAREVAIMYGWIDGLINGYDAECYVTRFTPRRPKGLWSKINRAIAEELIAAGTMTPAGLAAVEAAKADGRWEAAYDPASTMEVPADFQAALDANPQAKAFFAGISKANRYAVLFRIHTATNPEARARQIEKLVAMLAEGRTLHP